MSDIHVQAINVYSPAPDAVPADGAPPTAPEPQLSVTLHGSRSAMMALLGPVLLRSLGLSVDAATRATSTEVAGAPSGEAKNRRSRKAPETSAAPDAPAAAAADPAQMRTTVATPPPAPPPAAASDDFGDDEFESSPPPAPVAKVDPLETAEFFAKVKPMQKIKDVLVAISGTEGFEAAPTAEKHKRAAAWFAAHAAKVDHFASAIAEGKGETVQKRASECIKVMWVG